MLREKGSVCESKGGYYSLNLLEYACISGDETVAETFQNPIPQPLSSRSTANIPKANMKLPLRGSCFYFQELTLAQKTKVRDSPFFTKNVLSCCFRENLGRGNFYRSVLELFDEIFSVLGLRVTNSSVVPTNDQGFSVLIPSET